MSQSPVELVFLGTGTSAGVPMIGCHCAVCTSTDPRDKRTRPSVVIRAGGVSVLVDAAPELRLQCIANGIDRIDAIVFTHGHADHIMGLDDVRRFNAVQKQTLDVWADALTHEVLKKCFGYCFREPNPDEKVFRPHLNARQIRGPFTIGGATWHPVPLLHGAMPVLGFRIGSLAYCTDVSHIPEQSFELLRGVEVLVLDGLQRHAHPTHFSIGQAVAAAQRIGAQRTLLTHIAHSVSQEAVGRELPAGVELAYDGLQIHTGP